MISWCPPGSASARLPAPIMIVISRCGLVNFFQVSGPCFMPLGTKTVEVLLMRRGLPSSMNSISPPRSSPSSGLVPMCMTISS